jgi:hypothetical protein
MRDTENKRPSEARRMPLWAFAAFTGLLFGVIAMLVAVIVGPQFQVAALAGGMVCCTAFSLAAFLESAAEIFMAIAEAILGFFGAIITMIAAIFSGFS